MSDNLINATGYLNEGREQASAGTHEWKNYMRLANISAAIAQAEAAERQAEAAERQAVALERIAAARYDNFPQFVRLADALERIVGQLEQRP